MCGNGIREGTEICDCGSIVVRVLKQCVHGSRIVGLLKVFNAATLAKLGENIRYPVKSTHHW